MVPTPVLIFTNFAFLVSSTQVKGSSSSSSSGPFTTNPVCVQNACVNPITPGLNDMSRLQNLVWQCSATGSAAPYLNFCKGALDYDPALASPTSKAMGLDKVVQSQDNAASTMFFYHLNGIGYDAWQYQDARNSDDPCVRSIWKMVCFTYFPKNQAGCKAGSQVPYFAPCKNTCSNYIKQCQVQCCDDSVQCVFSYNSTSSGGGVTGYVDADGPNALCTGSDSGSGRIGASLSLLLMLLGLHVVVDGHSSRGSTRSSTVAWTLICLLALSAVQGANAADASTAAPTTTAASTAKATATAATGGSSSSSSSSSAAGTHSLPLWMMMQEYLIKFEYVPPGQPATAASLNSCAAAAGSGVLQCSGRGVCTPWSLNPLESAGNLTTASLVSFCKCDAGWADPECRTARKSQLKAWILSVFLGFLGCDWLYLGHPLIAVLKLVACGLSAFWCFHFGASPFWLLTFGPLGVGWWAFDIVRIGSAPVYSSNFLLDNDLPHWVFVLAVFGIFGIGGFLYSLESYMTFRKQKREDILKTMQSEEANYDVAEDMRFLPRGQHSYSGYGSTLNMRVPSAGAPYAL